MATLEQLEVRVTGETSDLQRALADVDRFAVGATTRVKSMNAALASIGGTQGLPEATVARLDRMASALDTSREKAALLTAALGLARREMATLQDFAARIATPGAVTGAEVKALLPRLQAGELESTEKDIARLTSAQQNAIAQYVRLQERYGDALSAQLARRVKDNEGALSQIRANEFRALRGVGQGFARGAGAGLGIPLSFGLAVTGGLVIGQVIGREWQDANDRVTKFAESLAALRAEEGLSVETSARLGAQARVTGTQIESIGAGLKALRGTGVSFEEARAQIAAIEDPSLRAAAAQRLFGDAASGLIPLLSGEAAAARVTAEEIDNLVRAQRVQQLQTVIKQRGGGPLDGIASFAIEAKTGLDYLVASRGVAGTLDTLLSEAFKTVPGVGGVFDLLLGGGANEKQAAFDKSFQSLAAATAEQERAATVTAKFAGAQHEGTKSLTEMSAAAEAADKAVANLGDTMTAAERKTLGLASNVSEGLRQAIDVLQTKGALNADVLPALDIALRAHLDPQSTDLIVQDLQGIADFAGTTLSDSVNSILATRLSDIGENRLRSLLGVQEQRQNIAERIADIEDRIGERHKDNAQVAFDFSKAELAEKLRAREDEKAFFAFRDTHTEQDFSKQDARDRREIAKLQQQLADSEKAYPHLLGDIAGAEKVAEDFRALAEIVRSGGKAIEINHKLIFSVEGGPVLIMDRGEAVKNKALLIGMFGDSWAELMISAANAGKTIVNNTRAATTGVGGGGGGVLTP